MECVMGSLQTGMLGSQQTSMLGSQQTGKSMKNNCQVAPDNKNLLYCGIETGGTQMVELASVIVASIIIVAGATYLALTARIN